MPNRKKSKLYKAKQKSKLQKYNDTQISAEPDEPNESKIEYMDEKVEERTLKPGDLVKIKGLKSRPDLNGTVTMVTDNILENGRVPVMNDGPESIALRPECVDFFHQCPNKGYDLNQAFMVWPRTKGAILPTVGVIEDKRLLDDFLFDPMPDGSKMTNKNYEKYKMHLKNIFGWSKMDEKSLRFPTLQKCCTISHVMMFDRESKGPVKVSFPVFE